MIILSNGRTIAKDIDLSQNKLLKTLEIAEATANKVQVPFSALTSVPHPLNPGIDKKELQIDCSDGPTQGDIIVTMNSKGLVGYYTFDRVPTRLITEKVESHERAPQKVIGEEPYPVLHLWDYLHGRPLSVHIKRFSTHKEATVGPCILGSLSGGIPVYAQLTPALFEMYQKMYESKAAHIHSRYPNR